jgi:hypothetical protein
MNDADVLNQLSESLSGVHMDLPVETIVARGRSRQRHQRSRRIVTGAAAALVVVVLAVLTFATHGTTPPASTRGNIHLAAFTVVANSDGSATLTLIKGVPLDADALRQQLAQAGVPAVVTVGRACSNPVADSAALDQVVSVHQQTDGSVVMVITPSAMPNGSELSIGVFPTHKTWTLATADAPLSCTTNPNH